MQTIDTIMSTLNLRVHIAPVGFEIDQNFPDPLDLQKYHTI